MERTPDNDPADPKPPTDGDEWVEPPVPIPDDVAAGPQSPAPDSSRGTGHGGEIPPPPPGGSSGDVGSTPPPSSGGSGPSSPGGDGPKRLTRSADDRMIGGVAGGIARYLGVDSTVVRIATVVLTLFGGFGALLYVAGLLLMPSDSQAVATEDGNRTLKIVGIGLLVLIASPIILGGGFVVAGLGLPLAILALAGVLMWWLVSGEGPQGSARDVARRAALGVGVLFLCLAVAVGGAVAAGLGSGTVVSAFVILAGLMLIAGAFVGGIRWLIPPALSLALAIGFVAAAGIDLEGGVGERDYRPTSASDVRDSYRLGVGELTVDLRNADLPSGDTHVNFDLGIGGARLIVPEDVCVASVADIGIGAVDVFGRDNGGVDFDWDDRPEAAAGKSRVVVNADVGVGALLVRHDRTDDFDRGRRFGEGPHSDGDDDLENELGNTGCQETRAAR